MRLHRFYVNFPLGEEVVVENVDSGKELIHQWTRVFRYKAGDEVILFSSLNYGNDYTYRITSIESQGVSLAPISHSPNILPHRSISLIMAIPKKDVFEQVVRQATELGVTRIIPVESSRSEKKNLNFERLAKIAVEATEQSGRGFPPALTEILSVQEAITLNLKNNNVVGTLSQYANPVLVASPEDKEKTINVWVGPEGGWTKEEEQAFLDNGFLLVTSVPTTLKADTAAVHLISLILAAVS